MGSTSLKILLVGDDMQSLTRCENELKSRERVSRRRQAL
jgi:hypothetical protein